MLKLASTLLAFGILVGFFSLTLSVALAKELPESAKSQLKQILASKEYQPRGSSTSSKWKTAQKELWHYAINHIEEVWNSVSRYITKHADSGDKPSFMTWIYMGLSLVVDILSALLTFLWQVWQLLAILLIISLVTLLAYKYRNLIPFLSSNTPILLKAPNHIAPNSNVNTPKNFKIEALLSKGHYSEALTLLRERLRNECCKRLSRNSSVTDRELLTLLPPQEALTLDFEPVARLFESIVFAGQKADSQVLDSVFRTYVKTPRSQS